MKRIVAISTAFLFFGMASVGSLYAEDDIKDEDIPVAFVVIKATAEGSMIEGKIMFFETEDGLYASGNVSGVDVKGKHGIHVHENGSCEDMGKAAGGHFNPHGAQHGFLPEDGLEMAHAGDMGNIEIDETGNGELKVELPQLSLEGVHGIVGKAVILHEMEDDFGQPTGNAGGRIGCGIIYSAETSEITSAEG